MGEDACRTFQGSKSVIWYLYGVSNISGLPETQLVPFRVMI